MWVMQQIDNGDTQFTADGGASENAEVIFQFAPGVTAGFGRGATDLDRTYLFIRRSDGTKMFLFVDTGTTLSVSTTKP